MAMAERLRGFFRARGVCYGLVPHPRSCCARETAKLAHVGGDHIAKGVLLEEEGAYLLVVVPGSPWVKLKSVSEALNRQLELASEAQVAAFFADCQPGSIPPFGAAYGIETAVDESVLSLADVYFESGDHEQLGHVSGKSFNELLRGARRGYFSHPG